MASFDMTITRAKPDASRLSVARCALTAAAVLTALFVLCWAGAAAGVLGSHMYIALFTLAPVASLTALGVGVCWSLAFGLVIGALTAATYNALGFLTRG